VDLCVVAHCQVHFYEVILFHLFAYCNLLNLAFVRSTITHKG
jgi:hypothetical protein